MMPTLLEYCEQDVHALARLLLPYIDLDQALLRGRYLSEGDWELEDRVAKKSGHAGSGSCI